MQQGWELSSWLWRLPLAALLWLSINLILFLLAASLKVLQRGTLIGDTLARAPFDATLLFGLWSRAVLWTIPASAALGLAVIFVTIMLRIVGRVSFADPAVRRALWLAGADVAIPLALLGALLVYLWFNPPRLMF